ncbi:MULTISPECIES: hypothetical protein [Microbacterium]|jgi:hypothetical protein|uniref:hypothetical protein n=1 Tax=Microbacterium TaxID=33882 RepID=UPI0023DC8EF8|nr:MULTISPECIES: hypothetical protein [Microbacterium]MDF2044802.1 hypothetical protein [Microbacterium sp. Kw_RZR3]MDQ1075324.1 hypothetical protein [Microbacterium sp. SORGH_AS_0969]MDQ1115554.1 hypothetical protein [Microbacterium testaceum]
MLLAAALVVLSLALAVVVVAALVLWRRPAIVVPHPADARRPRRRRATWRPVAAASS